MIDKENYWWVLRVRSGHELKAVSDLECLGVKSYTPSVEVIRQWSDRKKKIQKPLISRHVFVQLTAAEQRIVFGSRSVLGYMNVHGARARVWPKEIKQLQQYCNNMHHAYDVSIGAHVDAPVLGVDTEIVEVKNGICYSVSDCGRFKIQFKLAR